MEIVTENDQYINFQGKIGTPIPRIDEIVSRSDFEASMYSPDKPIEFKLHASVRISVEYGISEYADYLDDAAENQEDDPEDQDVHNLFTWIEYCTSDALESLREDLDDAEYLSTALTVRGF